MKTLSAGLHAVSLAALLTALNLSASLAADLPTQKGAPSLYSPAPTYNWAGTYVGLNGGYGWGQQDPLAAMTSGYDTATVNVSGGLVGATGGMQMQMGHSVLGVEGDVDWADLSGSKTLTPTIGGAPQAFQATLKGQIDWISTGRVRYGWAQDNWLIFGSAGLALLGSQPRISNIQSTKTGVTESCASVSLPNCNANGTAAGFAFGTGVEYGFTPNWSAKLEYLYIGEIQGPNLQNLNLIRAGVNYRFGG